MLVLYSNEGIYICNLDEQQICGWMSLINGSVWDNNEIYGVTMLSYTTCLLYTSEVAYKEANKNNVENTNKNIVKKHGMKSDKGKQNILIQ